MSLTTRRPEGRLIEEAALAIVIERGSEPTTEAALVEEMTEVCDPPERSAAIRLAVKDLIACGLLARRAGGVIDPTPAAWRVAELEL